MHTIFISRHIFNSGIWVVTVKYTNRVTVYEINYYRRGNLVSTKKYDLKNAMKVLRQALKAQKGQ